MTIIQWVSLTKYRRCFKKTLLKIPMVKILTYYFGIYVGPHHFDIGEEGEEDDDFLAASWASSKTVCSDAFDFLFDEKNMNPENVLEKHPDVIEIKPDKNFGNSGNSALADCKHSKCCVIS